MLGCDGVVMISVATGCAAEGAGSMATGWLLLESSRFTINDVVVVDWCLSATMDESD